MPVRPSACPSVYRCTQARPHVYMQDFSNSRKYFKSFYGHDDLTQWRPSVRPSVRPSARPASLATTCFVCLLLRGWPTRGTSSCLNVAIASPNLAAIGTSSRQNVPGLVLGCEASNPSAPSGGHPRWRSNSFVNAVGRTSCRNYTPKLVIRTSYRN